MMASNILICSSRKVVHGVKNVQRSSQHKITLERFGFHIWSFRTTHEPCTTTKPSVRCMFMLEGLRGGDMTRKKAKPNKILGKHPLWHSRLSSHPDSKAWCLCTAAPYCKALGFSVTLKDALRQM